MVSMSQVCPTSVIVLEAYPATLVVNRPIFQIDLLRRRKLQQIKLWNLVETEEGGREGGS